MSEIADDITEYLIRLNTESLEWEGDDNDAVVQNDVGDENVREEEENDNNV